MARREMSKEHERNPMLEVGLANGDFDRPGAPRVWRDRFRELPNADVHLPESSWVLRYLIINILETNPKIAQLLEE